MAWFELKESQKIEQRWDGGYMWRRFLADWTDINAYPTSFDRYYWIGMSLSDDPGVWPASGFLKSLRMCNIVITPADGFHNKIYIDLEYSTKQDKTTYEAYPGCVQSHDISMDADTYTVSVDDDFLDKNGDLKSWQDIYQATSATGTPPVLNYYKPQTSMVISAYHKKYLPKRILNRTGKINSVNFLADYLARITGNTEIETENMQGFVDLGAWMFTGANITRARIDSYRYQFLFKWSEWGPWISASGTGGWNHPYGLIPSLNLYETFDFMELFDEMWDLAVPGIIHGNR